MHKKSLILAIAIVAFNSCSAQHRSGHPAQEGYQVAASFDEQQQRFILLQQKLAGLQNDIKSIRSTRDRIIESPYTPAKICLGLAILGAVGCAGGIACGNGYVATGGGALCITAGSFSIGTMYHERSKLEGLNRDINNVTIAIEKLTIT